MAGERHGRGMLCVNRPLETPEHKPYTDFGGKAVKNGLTVLLGSTVHEYLMQNFWG